MRIPLKWPISPAYSEGLGKNMDSMLCLPRTSTITGDKPVVHACHVDCQRLQRKSNGSNTCKRSWTVKQGPTKLHTWQDWRTNVLSKAVDAWKRSMLLKTLVAPLLAMEKAPTKLPAPRSARPAHIWEFQVEMPGEAGSPALHVTRKPVAAALLHLPHSECKGDSACLNMA